MHRFAALFGILALAIVSPARAADVPIPTLTGPVATSGTPGDAAHDYPFFASNHDLAQHGYIEEEYFVSGTANRYETPNLANGSIQDAGHAYKTRVIVRRPADPRRFNGVVLVEWLNVTNGFDADNAWFFGWEHMLHAGYAWVGVSAQQVGVDRLKSWSANRYGALDVTDGGKIKGDALAYDIYAQVGAALRHPKDVDLLHGLHPQQVIAIGESQSASKLSVYINSVGPLAPVYDGFLLLSPLGARFRPDLTAPVFKISTEYDVQEADAAVRQPDGPKYRAWEVAAASHVDQHLRASREPLELRDFGTSGEAQVAPTCANPAIGTRVATSDVLAAAYDHLTRWIANGQAPPSAPRIEVTAIEKPAGRSGRSAAIIARDKEGLAEGGIRLSEVAVPTGINVGTNKGPGSCVRWGSYTPFDVAKLAELYPSHADYVAKVKKATENNLQHGFILPDAAQRTIDEAERSDIGGAP